MKKMMASLFASISALSVFALTLDEGFRTPPNEAKPQTWFHMMNGNVSKEGVTRDFEAMAAAGLGGMQIFAVGCAIPAGPVAFDSPEWHGIMRHAHEEAKRLGLEMCILNCAGWSNSGGPWLKAEDGMKETRFTETAVKGPSRFSGVLPREKDDNGFYADIAVLAYPTPAKGPGLSKLGEKIGLARVSWAGSSDVLPHDLRPRSAAQIVAKDTIIDLTDRMAPDGRLAWDVPAGDWTILRIGYICNGRCNHPAPAGGKGFEVDKLSARAMDRFFDGYIGRVCRALGVKPGEPASAGLRAVLIDSYEVGCQNWTQDFDKTFEKRMGYAIRPYLPVFAGRVVGSAEESERVLEDFRRVVADLFAENYAGRFAQLCREHGLVSYIEPYFGCNSDDLQYGQDAAVPMAEFWSRARSGDHAGDTGNSRFAASLAHVWGRRFAATESFTAGPPTGGQWLTTPFSIKNQGDRAFAEGINRIVFHTYTHQPWGDVLPGMTMGRWGIMLSRNQTWWRLAPEFFRYQARCQWMLMEGGFVADALIWTGEAAPNRNGRGNPDVGLPRGYDRDVCATRAVEMLTVRDGKVVAPGGVEYSILVLPNTDAMSERMIRRVGELVDAGARVVAQKRPTRSIGLTEWNAGGAGAPRTPSYQSLVDSVWAKGVLECPVADALSHLGIAPDFTSTRQDSVYIHRRGRDADWYFVACNNETPVSFEASFRVGGRRPEIWDAVTGGMRPADVWREANGRTYVTLDFKPSGSAFVVFREKTDARRHVVGASVAVTPRDEKVALPGHRLVIKKAVYGVFPDLVPPASVGKIQKDWEEDITEKVAAQVRGGRVSVKLDNDFAGRIFAYGFVKTTRIEYELDGASFKTDVPEHCVFKVGGDDPQPPPAWEWRDGQVLAWQPLAATLAYSDGSSRRVAAEPPAAVAVAGVWSVSFPAGWGAPESVEFPELKSWTTFPDDGVRYFSGTATYRKSVKWKMENGKLDCGGRVMLDLGDVKNFAEVTVNGRRFPALWQPPYRLDITDAVRDADGALDLEVKVTNLWPNRLIGDDALFAPDCEWKCNERKNNVTEWGIAEIPQWVKEGRKSPTGRYTFTTWRHWTKRDAPLASGLIGPVKIRFGETAGDK